MRKVWRKLHCQELLRDFALYGFLILGGGCFLIFFIMRITDRPVLFAGDMLFIGLSVAAIFVIFILALLSLYKISKSYVLWYKGILNSIPMPVIVTDKDAKWRQINKTAQNIMNLKENIDIRGLSSHHLIDDNGCVIKKAWTHEGVSCSITGNRLHCNGEDVGYLILLNNVCKTSYSCETQTGMTNEINRLLSRLSTATDQFNDYAKNLVGYTVLQTDIITELTDVIAAITSGKLNEPEALNEKMHAVKTDMQRHVESSQEHLETIRRTVEALDVTCDSIDKIIHNVDSTPQSFHNIP